MKIDFHYGVMKILARAVGFKEGDAEVIAFASQHTDDANLHGPVRINKVEGLKLDEKLKDWMQILGVGREHLDRKLVKVRSRGKTKVEFFDPICTAHSDLDYLTGISPDAQRKVYLSFHFLPTKVFAGQSDYDYCTRPAKELPNLLLESALNAYGETSSGVYRNLSLVALGIALHTYADTWAHEGFSGRWNPEDNNTEAVEVNGKVPKPTAISILGRLVPVGHLDASDYPDRTDGNIYFRFDRGEEIRRNNTSHFLKAALHIMGKLAPLNWIDVDKTWETMKETLTGCLRKRLDAERRLGLLGERFKGIKGFDGLSLQYDKTAWERWAIRPSPSRASGTAPEYFTTGSHDLWFNFHVAAAAQRAFVKSHIKPL